MKVLIAVSSHGSYDRSNDPTGYWLEEISHFQQVVASAGIDVEFVSPAGGKPPLDPKSGSKKDKANIAFFANATVAAKLECSFKPDQVHAKDYGVIYYAGGHGAMWDFSNNAALNLIAQQIYASGGVVAAVCHGVAGLLELKHENGRYLIDAEPVTGFSNLEERLIGRTKHVPYLLEDELRRRGAHYHKALLPFTSSVSIGNRIVTGQNPQSTTALAKAVLKCLNK